MSQTETAIDAYLTGLRNQHAVETQVIGTIQNELPRMQRSPELHARMQQDHARSVNQATRLDDLLARRGTRESWAKEAVTGAVATVAGFTHLAASDEVLNNVLAAIGSKAYETLSYKLLLTLAEAAGAADDKPILGQLLTEEQEMGVWLGSHIPALVATYLRQQAA